MPSFLRTGGFLLVILILYHACIHVHIWVSCTSAFIDFLWGSWYFWLVENFPSNLPFLLSGLLILLVFILFSTNRFGYCMPWGFVHLTSHITNELRHLPFRQWLCNHCHSVFVFRVLWRAHLAQSVEGR